MAGSQNNEEESQGEGSGNNLNKLQMEAMMATMRKAMQQQFENMRADMKRVVSEKSRRSHDPFASEQYFNNSSRTHASRRRSRERIALEPKPPDSVLYKSNQFRRSKEKFAGCGERDFKPQECTRSSTWNKPHNTFHTSQSMEHSDFAYDQPINRIELYSFAGNTNYLEWERSMEDWFYCNSVQEEKRLSYAVRQLRGKAHRLWVKEQDDRSFYNERIITTWKELKKLLRNQYVLEQKKTSARTVHKDSIQSGLSSPPLTSQEQQPRVKSSNPLKLPNVICFECKGSRHNAKDCPIKRVTNNISLGLKGNNVNESNGFVSSVHSSSIIHLSRSKDIDAGVGAGEEHLDQELDIQQELTEQKEMLTLTTAERQSREVEKRPKTSISFDCLARTPPDLASNETIVMPEPIQHLLLDAKISETHDLIRYCQTSLTGHSFKLNLFNLSTSSIMPLFCPISAQKDAGYLEKNRCLGAGDTPDVLAIKGKPPDLQEFQSKIIGPKQSAMNRIGEFIRGNTLLASQEKELTRSDPIMEKPPGTYQRTTKQRTQGSYLESQKRMKPNLLSLGTNEGKKTIVAQPLLPIFAKDEALLSLTNRVPVLPSRVTFILQDLKDETQPDYPRRFLVINGKKLQFVFDPGANIEKTSCDIRNQIIVVDTIIPRYESLNSNSLEFEHIRTLYYSNNLKNVLPSCQEFEHEKFFRHGGFIFDNFGEPACFLLNSVLGSNCQIFEKTLDLLESSVANQTVAFPYVYNEFMTVLMHLIFAKGADVNAGTKEEPPDSQVLLSKLFTRTGIGVAWMQHEETITNDFESAKKRPRRTAKREEDERFKPPDLDQDIHQDINRFLLIKEAPPDTIYKSKIKPRIADHFKKINDNKTDHQGKYIISLSSKVTDLVPFIADQLDLRSNPFQVGEDDVILPSTKVLKHEEGIEPEEKLEPVLNGAKYGAKEQPDSAQAKAKEIQVPFGPITRSRQAHFHEALQQLLHTIEGSLECANPTTLVVIQAT